MDSNQEHDELVRWLERPETYSHQPGAVERIETHISQVFLAGEYVFKLKKPVKFGFLDFLTIHARERACREEVRLNRRLAGDVYMDVVPITRGAADGYRLGGNGTVVDWIVKMRRLPTELTLDALDRQGQLTPEHIQRLSETLTTFYRSLSPLPVAPDKYVAGYLSRVRDNQRELLALKHHLPRSVVERVHGFQLQFMQLEAEILENRVRIGRIVEGHGDLRPEHICLTSPVAIFDCIEFNADFCVIDVADELAFLAAECDFLGPEWVGPQILAAYQAESGDCPPAQLWDFYKCYRACVRAKVAALRADQLSGQAQTFALDEAARHLDLADRYSASWVKPLVIAVGGLSGTGKSTLASELAEMLGAELLRTDVVRQETFASDSPGDSFKKEIYSPAGRQRVYDELFRRANELHLERVNVILDGTFSRASVLEQARALATHPRHVFLAVECVCRPEVARSRIRQRLAAGRDPSEAQPELHDTQRRQWESWPAWIPQVRVDTQQPLLAQVEQVMAILRSHSKQS